MHFDSHLFDVRRVVNSALSPEAMDRERLTLEGSLKSYLEFFPDKKKQLFNYSDKTMLIKQMSEISDAVDALVEILDSALMPLFAEAETPASYWAMILAERRGAAIAVASACTVGNDMRLLDARENLERITKLTTYLDGMPASRVG